MIISEVVSVNDSGWTCVCYADTKEAASLTDPISGLPSDKKLAPGSFCYTGNGYVGILLTNNTWSWK